MVQDNIQYGFALQDESEVIIDIDSLTRDSSAGHKYFCPQCHSEMYPTFGPKQEHHFRHNGTQCRHDSYLHTVAEHLFHTEYLKCLEADEPFILELHSRVPCDRNCTEKKNRICTSFHNTTTVDLTKIYKTVKLETNVNVEDGRFRRPDILLTSDSGEQLWIEIWVKHETSEEKRNDGHIVELKITSEKDLEQIKNHKLTKTVDNELAVRLFNVEFGEDCIISSINYDSHTCTDFRELVQFRKPFAKSSYYQKRPSRPTINTDLSDDDFDVSTIEWVDLGLPSGTFWAKCNTGCQLSFHMAKNRFAFNLPSKVQAHELYRECQRLWDSETKSVKFIGPNGNFILLPCKEKNESYWLRDYEDRWREHGQRFVIGQDNTFFVNDREATSLSSIRLIKYATRIQSIKSESTLF